MTDDQAFERLGVTREFLSTIRDVTEELGDEQLSVAIWKAQSWVIAAGNRMAELRQQERTAT